MKHCSFAAAFLCAVAVGLALSCVRANAAALPSQLHSPYLYVADGGAGAVRRYPLSLNGALASAMPQTMLLRFSPFNIQFDARGELYVDNGSQVVTFAGFSTGYATRLRTLTISQYDGAFAVDAAGFVYAAVGQAAATVNVYAPGASGNATPIHVLTLPAPQAPALVADSAGTLYSLGNVPEGVYYFPHPLTDTVPSGLLSPISPEFDFFITMGLSDNRVMTWWSPRVIRSQWDTGDFTFVRPWKSGVGSDAYYYAEDCYSTDEYPNFIMGLAGYGRYAFLACAGPYYGIFVYDLSKANQEDRRVPYQMFLSSPIVSPNRITVWPTFGQSST